LSELRIVALATCTSTPHTLESLGVLRARLSGMIDAVGKGDLDMG
jgi:hypothetical protein